VRARTTWLLFVLASGMVGAVMIGVTWALLRLDASGISVQKDALREELVRLSLWRMDSVITPLLSREIAEAGLDVGDDPLPNGVHARFVIRPGKTDATIETVGPVDLATEVALMKMIAGRNPVETLLAVENATREVEGTYRNAKRGVDGDFRDSQQVRNANEYAKRVASVQDNFYNSSLGNPTFAANQIDAQNDGRDDGVPAGVPPTVGEVPMAILEMMRPLWWGDQLVMLRRARDGGGERIDGVWLDWTAVHGILQGEIVDLLPDATLVPLHGDVVGDDARRLATLPVGLEPGYVEFPPHPRSRPLRIAIGAAWVFVVVAVGAVALLLRGSLALSERRAAFVSAVTHELRTPLTTFRMYTEMLSDGMVEEGKRAGYLSTLRREAERLGQLVENVLSYARIEADGGQAPGRVVEVLEVDALVERSADRLAERARAAGLELQLEIDASARALLVRVDVVAVEQILFNLVDNAAKYGATEAHPVIDVHVAAMGGTIEIGVRDFGPGVPEGERARVFEPFAKGVAHAAGTKPGVGLGLALSRRLAQQMGGRLELRAADRGAVFVLSLPVA
jgi:signal transduction histidine kinase